MKPIKKNLMWLIAVLMMMTMQQTAAAQTADDADPDAKYATELLKVGTAVPAFSLKTPDGKTVKLSDFKGKYLILDFWASWCPDCRKDAPNLVRMYDKFHKRGFEFLGISFDTDKEAWKKAIKQYGIAYRQVSELKKFHDTDISKAYGVKWIPSMYLIDKEGKVVLGTVVSDKLEALLTELAEGK